MADSLLINLNAAASVAATDLLYSTVDPSGTPLDKKCTVNVLTAKMGAVASREAWVDANGDDSTGAIGNRLLPFLTIDAALVALGSSDSTLKIVHIGLGTFASPTGGAYWTAGPTFTTRTSKIFNNTRFIGSGVPHFKSDNTCLEGNGTILQGGFLIDNENVSVQDLGVDSGSAVCTNSYSGIAQEGLAFINIGQAASPGTKAPRKSCSARNIITICQSASAPVHGALFENVDGFHASNIETRFGIHGVVFKAINSTGTGFRSSGHNTDAMIIKANAYAPCYNIAISDVVMTTVSTGDGLIFDATSDSTDLTDITVNGVIANGVTTAIQWNAGSTKTIKRCQVNGLQKTGVTNAYLTSGTLTEKYTLLTNGISLRTAPTLLNTWANNGGGNADAEYWFENGALCVDGVIKTGSAPSVVFNIPASLTPATNKRAPTVCYGSSVFNLGDIAALADGTFYAESGVSTAGFYVISGRFPLP